MAHAQVAATGYDFDGNKGLCVWPQSWGQEVATDEDSDLVYKDSEHVELCSNIVRLVSTLMDCSSSGR